MPDSEALELNRVRVEFKNFSLQIDNLTLQSNQRVALVGTNGAGKTTVVKIASLVLKPLEGSVKIFGKKGFESAKLDRKLKAQLAVVFANPALLSATDVLGNTALPIILRGKNKKIAINEAKHWLDRFGVLHIANKRVWQLSSGEAHRVALARAFACKPKLLLLDEPFTHLDPQTRQNLITDLQSALDQTKTTVLFVSHSIQEAARFCSRIVVLSHGKIVQDAPSAEVLCNPATAEVASLVGFENRIVGRVVENRNGLVRISTQKFTLLATGNIPVGNFAVALFRAEDLTLHKSVPQSLSALNAFRCKVIGVHPIGARIALDLDAGVRLNALITQSSMERLNIKNGVELVATIKAVAIKTFRINLE